MNQHKKRYNGTPIFNNHYHSRFYYDYNLGKEGEKMIWLILIVFFILEIIGLYLAQEDDREWYEGVLLGCSMFSILFGIASIIYGIINIFKYWL